MLHKQLPAAIYSVAQTRRIDAASCVLLNCSEFELMQRAAAEALALIQQRCPQADRLLIVCGKGNNAGDGFVLAALAAQAFMQVDVYMHEPPQVLSALAKQAFEMASSHQQGINWLSAEGCEEGEKHKNDKQENTADNLTMALECADVIVDALLGIGINGAPRESYAALIKKINAIHKSSIYKSEAQQNKTQQKVLALDLPSGLCADTAQVFGEVINADLSLCFICLKSGLLMHAGLQHCGELVLADLDIPPQVFDTFKPQALLSNLKGADLVPRKAYAHKNSYGHVLVVGGGQGMGGAAILCAHAAARSGAGLVSLATQPQHVGAMLARCPDVMVHGVNSGQQLEPLLEAASVIVVGPGTIDDAWAQQMFASCVASDKPLVIDAGALNLLSIKMDKDLVKSGRLKNCILTPHPGEAARLLSGDLSASAAVITHQRLHSVELLAQKYEALVVLKGAGTLIANNTQILLSAKANAALATAGSGDVLAGIIGGLLAQKLKAYKLKAQPLESSSNCEEELELTPQQAAALAVNVHLKAADLALMNKSTMSVLASDLIEHLPAALLF